MYVIVSFGEGILVVAVVPLSIDQCRIAVTLVKSWRDIILFEPYLRVYRYCNKAFLT